MPLFAVIIIAVLLFFYISKKEKRWMNYGRLTRRKHIEINKHQYYIEEVQFNDYQDALQKYINITADITGSVEVLEVKYDLYDWTYSIFRFKDKTIELKHLRSLKKIRLIKSNKPISIEDYEKDNLACNLN